MPTSLSLETNVYGMLQNAGVHDATVTRLESRDDALSLAWVNDEGAACQLELGRVHHLCIKDFIGAQILAQIYVWPLADAGKAAASIPAQAWHTLFASTHRFSDIPTAAAQATIKHATACFVQCEFSYGGEIAVICEDVRVFALGQQSAD